MDISVKIIFHLFREERSWNRVDWLKGVNLMEKELIKISKRIFRTYKKIFVRDCVFDKEVASTEGDEFFEACEKGPPDPNTKVFLKFSNPKTKIT